jgi:hypothetical protein
VSIGFRLKRYTDSLPHSAQVLEVTQRTVPEIHMEAPLSFLGMGQSTIQQD